MAKGSVRKKGKKWYYRFYVEDASGKLIQRECVGTESKSETEKMLRQAIEDYDNQQDQKASDCKSETEDSDSGSSAGVYGSACLRWHGR